MRIADLFAFHSTRERSALRGHLQAVQLRRLVRSVGSAVVVVQARSGPAQVAVQVARVDFSSPHAREPTTAGFSPAPRAHHDVARVVPSPVPAVRSPPEESHMVLLCPREAGRRYGRVGHSGRVPRLTRRRGQKGRWGHACGFPPPPPSGAPPPKRGRTRSRSSLPAGQDRRRLHPGAGLRMIRGVRGRVLLDCRWIKQKGRRGKRQPIENS